MSKSQKDVSAIWLDIANAYGSIPHQLIFPAVKRLEYLLITQLSLKTTLKLCGVKYFTQSCPSSWHRQHKGIFASCTFSIILFLSGINLVIEYTMNCRICGYITSAKHELHLVRVFMDDNTMAWQDHTQVLLICCTKALTWARMRYNISKTRCFIVKRGRILNTCPLALQSDSESAFI